MAQDLKTFGRARLSFAKEADIDEFSSMLDKFERGVITPDQWRMFRLVRGAYGSDGGKSIIACHATAARGSCSRIVARLDGPVTTPRNDVHIVVTEHGWANLKGRSTGERARALIALAAPEFRDGLTAEARRQGLI